LPAGRNCGETTPAPYAGGAAIRGAGGPYFIGGLPASGRYTGGAPEDRGDEPDVLCAVLPKLEWLTGGTAGGFVVVNDSALLTVDREGWSI